MKLAIAIFLAVGSLVFAADLKPGPPAVVTVETRDMKVEFAGDRAWTICSCGFGNRVLADGTYKKTSSKKPNFEQ